MFAKNIRNYGIAKKNAGTQERLFTGLDLSETT
jgi:hypothetical protein